MLPVEAVEESLLLLLPSVLAVEVEAVEAVEALDEELLSPLPLLMLLLLPLSLPPVLDDPVEVEAVEAALLLSSASAAAVEAAEDPESVESADLGYIPLAFIRRRCILAP